MAIGILDRIRDGRTDLVLDHLAAGHPASSKDESGVRLIEWCAYYGDVSALRFLLDHGESLASLGDNLGLNGASFHGHWRLCEFLVESGADVNAALPDRPLLHPSGPAVDGSERARHAHDRRAQAMIERRVIGHGRMRGKWPSSS